MTIRPARSYQGQFFYELYQELKGDKRMKTLKEKFFITLIVLTFIFMGTFLYLRVNSGERADQDFLNNPALNQFAIANY